MKILKSYNLTFLQTYKLTRDPIGSKELLLVTFNLSNFRKYQIKYYLPFGIFLSGISISPYLVCQTPLSVVAVMTACCHVLRTEAEWAMRINTRYTSMSVIFIP